MPELIKVRCDSTELNYIKENNLNWEYSPDFGEYKVDVFIEEIEDLSDEQLVKHYGINYAYVDDVEPV